MSISTTPVTANVSGASWSVNVTACQLNTDITDKDFIVYNLTDGSVVNNSSITKTSSTQIDYAGVDLGAITIQVFRFTVPERYQRIDFASILSSIAYNEEIDAILKTLYELQVANTVAPSVIAYPLNQAYGPEWADDEQLARTAKVTYDKFEEVTDDIADANSAIALKANTSDVNSALALKANLASPALTGNPTAPTQAIGTADTKVATTQFVAQDRGRNMVVCRVGTLADSSQINAYVDLANFGGLVEEIDTGNIHTAGTITVPVSGWYEMGISGRVQAVTGTQFADNVLFSWSRNGNDNAISIYQLTLAAATNDVLLNVANTSSGVFFLSAGDTVVPTLFVGMKAGGRYNAFNFRYWFRPYF